MMTAIFQIFEKTYNNHTDDSITEIEAPKRLPPPLVDLVEDDILLNVSGNETKLLIKPIINMNEVTLESPGSNPDHWTDDMIKYYNDDWGNEDQFIVEKMQMEMDKHPSLWIVSEKDLKPKKKDKKSYLKCWNCCEFGHTMYNCREPTRLPKCHMCGVEGHVEKTCPNAICLNCGNQLPSYARDCYKCRSESIKQCSRCSMFGHHFINCSDHWRRFHSTIGKTDIYIPGKELYKSANEMWCCNCARKGHIQINCTLNKEICFPETFPFVASYECAFNDQKGFSQGGSSKHQYSHSNISGTKQDEFHNNSGQNRKRQWNASRDQHPHKDLNHPHEQNRPKKKKRSNKNKRRNEFGQNDKYHGDYKHPKFSDRAGSRKNDLRDLHLHLQRDTRYLKFIRGCMWPTVNVNKKKFFDKRNRGAPLQLPEFIPI